MTNALYANLIVDNGAGQPDRLFTYRIPADLAAELARGDRLVVPFGRSSKLVDALLWSFAEQKPNFKCKAAVGLLPKKYSFTKTQVILMQILRQKYAATYQKAYRTILPAGHSLVTLRTYTVLEDGFLQLKKGTYLSQTELEKLVKKSDIQMLLDSKKLSFKDTWDVLYSSKAVEYLRCEFHDLEAVLKKLSKNAVKQQRILKYVYSHKVVEYGKLCSACGASRADVMLQVKNGFITICEREKIQDINKYYDAALDAGGGEKPLTEQQEKAFEIYKNELERGPCRAVLNGVTGSGKTRLYIEMANLAINRGEQVLFLVPEIALTAQLVARIKAALKQKMAILHTHVSKPDKAAAYVSIKSGASKVVIGARSALFAPFDNLGLIVIDESHEGSYKSEQVPRYDAIKLAIALSENLDISLILGSATTTVELFAAAKKLRFKHLKLSERAQGAPLPRIHIIDMTATEMLEGRISAILYEKLKAAFDRGEQAMILHNRRGHAGFRQCKACGHVEKCINCDVSMAVANKSGDLYCRYCDYRIPKYSSCSICHEPVFDKKPAVKSIADDLRTLFPERRFEVVDSDTTRVNKDYLSILSDFEGGRVDAICGTQVIAKGLDFDNVTLAAIIDADQIMHAPDYMSAERAFALMYQLSGRAGRRKKRGDVYIQCVDTDNRVLKYLQNNDFEGFIREENSLREATCFPPYSSFVALRFVSDLEAQARDMAVKSWSILDEYARKKQLKLKIFRARAQHYVKIKNAYNYYVLIKNDGVREEVLVKLLYNVFVADKYKVLNKRVYVSLDFDLSHP